MAQRKWFTTENTQIGGLTAADLRILNRAARRIWWVANEPRQSDLTTLRMAYKPGMSADDLIAEVEGALP